MPEPRTIDDGAPYVFGRDFHLGEAYELPPAPDGTYSCVSIYRTFVPGNPAPQGSKRYVGNGVSIESSKKVKPWRADIREHFLACYDQPPMTGAVAVRLDFVMPRPASTPKRSTPPAIKRPDIDKLARAVLDAIGSAGAWTDDARVVDLHACKRLAEIGETPGVHIEVADLTPPVETATEA
ncbi:RusA family crossover junction endodeoxyribonuclease [Nocardia wallacei]|uniref:RusA family crossover junction endodeoxyribonuclease n=1 Tax=Nocardia wallacei TaxID=480035 RepID=UPI0024580329|nr:RusA family crossover junction endodeoxyribonuclease [Nocardia wallacei]